MKQGDILHWGGCEKWSVAAVRLKGHGGLGGVGQEIPGRAREQESQSEKPRHIALSLTLLASHKSTVCPIVILGHSSLKGNTKGCGWKVRQGFKSVCYLLCDLEAGSFSLYLSFPMYSGRRAFLSQESVRCLAGSF